jgi:ribosome-binding factor A
MQPYRRSTRVADLLREEISDIVINTMNDPRLRFISITDVELTEDLRLAKVYFSMLQQEKEKDALKALTNSKGYIKKELGKRVRIKFLPDLMFKIDESGKYGAKIDNLLKKIEEERFDTERTD